MNNSIVQSTLAANEKAVLVSVKNNEVVTTSLDVARYFGKEHSKVIRAIKALDFMPLFNQANFGRVEYKDAKGELRPMYYITRDGFTLLAMGFTGKKALQFKIAYINAFNEMEEQLRKGQAMKMAESMLERRIDKINEMLHAASHDAHYLPYGDLYPNIPYNNQWEFDKNLDRVFTIVQGAYLDGMSASRKLRDAEKKLAETEKRLADLKASMSKLISGACEELNK